jgi:hypothetical protein
MNPTTVYQLQAEIEQRLPSLGKWQALGLTLMVLAIAVQEGCHLSQLAEQLPDWGGFNTVKQRLKRWVQNPRLNVTAACEEWVGWVWSSCRSARPVLLVDETKLGDRIGVMMVSLAYEGRAIPLLWRCYRANSASDYPAQGQVLLIYGLLAHVLTLLPAGVRPLVQMDRGLAHSAAMLRALKALEVDFLVRVKQTARFTSRRGHSQLLSQLVKYGERSAVQGTLFARDHAVSGRICLIWEVGQREAWCLFTNLRQLDGGRYGLRWWQEESFKDLKSGGWQWQHSRIACPERMARLLLAMAVAYGWMLSLGSQLGDQPPAVQRQVATADDFQRYSLFRLGLRWFKRCIFSLRRPPLPVPFCFKPPAFRYAGS